MIDLAADAAAFFEDLAEEITFRPAVGDARVINAIVDRQALTAQQPLGLVAMNYPVAVRNDATLGIALGSLNIGSDRVELATRDGGAPESRAITGIISQDAGILVLEVS